MHVHHFQGRKWLQWDPIFKLLTILLPAHILRLPRQALSATSLGMCLDTRAISDARNRDPCERTKFQNYIRFH